MLCPCKIFVFFSIVTLKIKKKDLLRDYNVCRAVMTSRTRALPAWCPPWSVNSRI